MSQAVVSTYSGQMWLMPVHKWGYTICLCHFFLFTLVARSSFTHSNNLSSDM